MRLGVACLLSCVVGLGSACGDDGGGAGPDGGTADAGGSDAGGSDAGGSGVGLDDLDDYLAEREADIRARDEDHAERTADDLTAALVAQLEGLANVVHLGDRRPEVTLAALGITVARVDGPGIDVTESGGAAVARVDATTMTAAPAHGNCSLRLTWSPTESVREVIAARGERALPEAGGSLEDLRPIVFSFEDDGLVDEPGALVIEFEVDPAVIRALVESELFEREDLALLGWSRALSYTLDADGEPVLDADGYPVVEGDDAITRDLRARFPEATDAEIEVLREEVLRRIEAADGARSERWLADQAQWMHGDRARAGDVQDLIADMLAAPPEVDTDYCATDPEWTDACRDACVGGACPLPWPPDGHPDPVESRCTCTQRPYDLDPPEGFFDIFRPGNALGFEFDENDVEHGLLDSFDSEIGITQLRELVRAVDGTITQVGGVDCSTRGQEDRTVPFPATPPNMDVGVNWCDASLLDSTSLADFIAEIEAQPIKDWYAALDALSESLDGVEGAGGQPIVQDLWSRWAREQARLDAATELMQEELSVALELRYNRRRAAGKAFSFFVGAALTIATGGVGSFAAVAGALVIFASIELVGHSLETLGGVDPAWVALVKGALSLGAGAVQGAIRAGALGSRSLGAIEGLSDASIALSVAAVNEEVWETMLAEAWDDYPGSRFRFREIRADYELRVAEPIDELCIARNTAADLVSQLEVGFREANEALAAIHDDARQQFYDEPLDCECCEWTCDEGVIMTGGSACGEPDAPIASYTDCSFWGTRTGFPDTTYHVECSLCAPNQDVTITNSTTGDVVHTGRTSPSGAFLWEETNPSGLRSGEWVRARIGDPAGDHVWYTVPRL